MATTTSQINEIKEDLSDAYTALGAKGATLPAANARGSANLASTVNSISMPTYPNLIWNISGNGTVSAATGDLSHAFDNWVVVSTGCFDNVPFQYKYIFDTDITFPNLTTIQNNGMKRCFKTTGNPTGSTKKKLSFPALTSIGVSGLEEGCNYYCAFDTVEFNSLVELSSEKALYFFAYNSSTAHYFTTVSFPVLKTVSGSQAMYCAFSNQADITAISFPELETVSGNNGMYYVFGGCSSVTTLSLPKLKNVTGKEGMGYFAYSTGLTSATFPELLTISGVTGARNIISNSASLVSVSFPKLTTLGLQSFLEAFSWDTSLTSVSLPELTTVDDQAFARAFYYCSGLTSISFPKLSTIQGNPFSYKENSWSSSRTYDTFSGCSLLTEVHFPAAIQATIEALDGYSSKWGASNATIYFDL